MIDLIAIKVTGLWYTAIELTIGEARGLQRYKRCTPGARTPAKCAQFAAHRPCCYACYAFKMH